MIKYRPWGLLDWTMSVSSRREWRLIGAIGTEDRSLEALRWTKELGLLKTSCMVEVLPMESGRYEAQTLQRLASRRDQFFKTEGDDAEVHTLELLAELYEIESLAEVLASNSSSVILDISSLPKRFFFLIIRALLRSTRVRDLVLTYSCPESYLRGQKLSEGAGKWDYLPGFLGKERESDVMIAAVGFMVESLQDYLSSSEAHPAVQLLIPFPANPSSIRRAWDSIFSLQSNRSGEKFVKHRVDASDMSMAFDRICSLSRNVDAIEFAPFGPKPISAAMCLFAAQQESAVHYPQPESYHPDYSSGIGIWNKKPHVNAYWVKHAGVNLYRV